MAIINTEKHRWYFNHGRSYEEFSVLFDDGYFVLVKNDNTGDYSFGLARDFGTLFGFPVDQSCLSLSEAESVLNDFIRIDTGYIGKTGGFAEQNIKRWENMISALMIEV